MDEKEKIPNDNNEEKETEKQPQYIKIPQYFCPSSCVPDEE